MFPKFRRVALAAGSLALSASCSHSIVVRPAPSYDVLAFDAPLPAAAAVYVNAAGLRRVIRIAPDEAGGYGWCGDSQYPVDGEEALGESVITTLAQVMREVRPTATPIDREAMEAGGFDSVIVVRVDEFDGAVTGDPVADFEATAQLTLSVSAFTRDGLILREIVYGSGVRNASGITCNGGAEALGLAVEAAIESVMTELGEIIANSPELRDSLGA